MKSVVLTVMFVFFQILIHNLEAQYLPAPKPIICPPPMVRACVSPCFDTCQKLAQPPLRCPLICYDGCECPKDTYRQGDECVPASKCIVRCPENMRFDPCPKFNDVTCATLRENRKKENGCFPHCVCNPGYVFEKLGGRCVKVSQCPK